MSNALNISLKQGEDFLRVLTLKDGAAATLDLTGYSFRSQSREKYTQTSPTFTFTFVVKNQVTNKGQVEWSLANTALVPLVLQASKTYLYDVEMVSPDGTVVRILEGKATVSPEVTK